MAAGRAYNVPRTMVVKALLMVCWRLGLEFNYLYGRQVNRKRLDNRPRGVMLWCTPCFASERTDAPREE